MEDSEYSKQWNKYLLYMDLYKLFHQMTINAMIFGSAIVGGLFAFYIQNQHVENAKYILWLLVTILFIASILSVVSAGTVSLLNKGIKELSMKLEINPYPTTTPLKYILFSTSVFCSILAIEVFALFFNY